MSRIASTLILLLILVQIGCTNQATTKEVLPEESTVSPLAVHKDDVDTRSPLLVSNDFGQTWNNASQGLPSEIQVSFMERKGNEMVIATDNAALFISSENRSQWNQIGKDLPNKKINALHISGETIFVGVYRKGIYKSIDNGVSWKSLNFDLSNLSVQTIWAFEGQLFVGTDEGISKYLEKERSWKTLSITAQVLSIYSNEGKLVAGTSRGTAISFDKGESWNWIRKEGAVHYTHHVGKRIVELGLNGDLYFSDDWGNNWIASQYQPRAGSYIYELVKIGSHYIMSNNYGIHRSSNEGKNWNLIYASESMGFFDLLVIDNKIYGGTRTWDEYRKRNQ